MMIGVNIFSTTQPLVWLADHLLLCPEWSSTRIESILCPAVVKLFWGSLTHLIRNSESTRCSSPEILLPVGGISARPCIYTWTSVSNLFQFNSILAFNRKLIWHPKSMYESKKKTQKASAYFRTPLYLTYSTCLLLGAGGSCNSNKPTCTDFTGEK